MYELKESDFILKNKKICLKILTQPTILFIYSTNCTHCKTFYPIFINLSKTITKIKFAILNISYHPNIEKYSRDTEFKIDYVPIILFYYNSEPIRQFKNKRTLENLVQFIEETLKFATTTSNKMQNINPQYNENKPNSSSSFRTLSESSSEDNIETYLTLDKAYK